MRAVRLRDDLGLRVRSAGRGAPLLLVHGFTGAAEAWGADVAAGLARDFRVLSPDLLGHGESDKPREPARYALASLIEDLCEVLDAHGIGRAIWLGYSMGGRISLAAAIERPERVAALVLEGASPGIADPALRRARAASDAALAQRLESDGLATFVEDWMRQPLFATQRRLGEGVLEEQRARRLRNDPAALAACLRGGGSGVQPTYWKRLHEIRCPVLLLTGGEDAKFGGIAAAMAEALPDARRETIPNAGHATHLERPDEFVRRVRRFATGL